jgi:hypothetical protein
MHSQAQADPFNMELCWACAKNAYATPNQTQKNNASPKSNRVFKPSCGAAETATLTQNKKRQVAELNVGETSVLLVLFTFGCLISFL